MDELDFQSSSNLIFAGYSHLSNKCGGWNKGGGGAKNGKSLNVEGVININFWARIKFYSSKWLWEKLSLVSAIILDTLVIKKQRFDKKGHNEGRPLKSSIFELELSSIAQNDQEKNCY